MSNKVKSYTCNKIKPWQKALLHLARILKGLLNKKFIFTLIWALSGFSPFSRAPQIWQGRVGAEWTPKCNNRISDVRYFSKGIFPKRELQNEIFPCGNLPNVKFSHVETSQMCNFPKSVLAAALGSHCWRPTLTFDKLPLGKLHIWKVVT